MKIIRFLFAFISVHLRTEIDMSEVMNKAYVTITVDGRELKADG
jgi:hypothetical protein